MELAEYEGNWIGTSRGSIFADVHGKLDAKSGRLSARFALRGIRTGDVLVLEGEFDASPTEIKLTQVEPKPTTAVEVIVKPTLFRPDAISGDWTASDGNSGIIQLERHKGVADGASASPLQVHFKEERLAPVTVYRGEFEGLLSVVRETFPPESLLVITAKVREVSRREFAESFLQRSDLPNVLNDLSITITDTSKLIHRSVSVAFQKENETVINVAGEDPTWVTGHMSNITAAIIPYSNPLFGFYKKYSFWINIISTIILLSLLPEMNLTSRFIFCAFVLVFLVIVFRGYVVFARTKIYFNDASRGKQEGFFRKIAIGAATATVLGALASVYKYLVGLNLTLEMILRWMESN